MKVLSWDVGVKNLAFCLLDWTHERWSIADWGVINLMTSVPCCVTCDASGAWVWRENVYCGDHCRGVPQTTSTLKKADLIHALTELAIAHEATETRPALLKKYTAWMRTNKAVPIKAVKSAKYMNMDAILEALKRELDKRGLPDVVVIEQQMKSRMIAVSTALSMYYRVHGVRSGFISATKKLQGAGGKQTTYAQRKKRGIEVARAHLTGSPWLDVLNRSDKKDDLADSFLQALAFTRAS